MKLLARFIFWVFGWKTEGKVPPLKKFVAIGAPHTSGWDVVFGLSAILLWDLKITFFGKQELFRFPLGNLLRYLGGVPVDRFSSHNMVDQAVKLFNERDEMILALAPEGTRAYVEKWRTGFYYIATQAKVPIVFGYIDFKRKVVGIGETFYPTGDIEKDIADIKNYFKQFVAKHPEKGVY
ncbi:MAG: lysophospholipid acyltransferase family protein [Chitinophagales bacterium]